MNLDLDGIQLYFSILDYSPSTNSDDEWCRVELIVQSGSWLDYRIKPSELLMSSEVENLVTKIDMLLNGELCEITEIANIEPDLEFILYPKLDLRNNPNVLYVKKGYEILDISMDLQVNFWSNGLTNNRLLMSLDRNDILIFNSYLKSVIEQKIDRRNT